MVRALLDKTYTVDFPFPCLGRVVAARDADGWHRVKRGQIKLERCDGWVFLSSFLVFLALGGLVGSSEAIRINSEICIVSLVQFLLIVSNSCPIRMQND